MRYYAEDAVRKLLEGFRDTPTASLEDVQGFDVDTVLDSLLTAGRPEALEYALAWLLTRSLNQRMHALDSVAVWFAAKVLAGCDPHDHAPPEVREVVVPLVARSRRDKVQVPLVLERLRAVRRG